MKLRDLHHGVERCGSLAGSCGRIPLRVQAASSAVAGPDVESFQIASAAGVLEEIILFAIQVVVSVNNLASACCSGSCCSLNTG